MPEVDPTGHTFGVWMNNEGAPDGPPPFVGFDDGQVCPQCLSALLPGVGPCPKEHEAWTSYHRGPHQKRREAPDGTPITCDEFVNDGRTRRCAHCGWWSSSHPKETATADLRGQVSDLRFLLGVFADRARYSVWRGWTIRLKGHEVARLRRIADGGPIMGSDQ